MATDSLSGIEAALDGLIGSQADRPSGRSAKKTASPSQSRSSTTAGDTKRSKQKKPTTKSKPAKPAKDSTPPPPETETDSSIPQPTPTGRPPGRKSGEGPLKARATVWVEAELIAEYRRRVWDERCQLGELIERALREYQQRHWPKK